MEKIDFSTNSKKINNLYSKIVRGEPDTSYGVFTVDNSSILDATASGSGSLDDFVEEFDDGSVQFGLVRVTVPGSDVYKNILLGWCPDNAPTRLRLSFAPTFAEVAKIFSGYHIQITARDSDDLDVSEMLSRVGAAAGARYTYHAGGASATPVVPKPAFKPSPVTSNATSAPTPVTKITGSKPQNTSFKPTPKPVSVDSAEDDGWGDAKAVEERDLDTQPLEDVPSAYKPTKVDIKELRSQKSDTISSQPRTRQHVAKSIPTDSENTPPVRKVDVEQKKEEKAFSSKPKSGNGVSVVFPASKPVTPAVVQPAFGSKPSFGSKVGSGTDSSYSASSKPPREGVFQNHANENGLTPAQAWAQKRGKYSVEPTDNDTEIQNDISKLSVGESGAKPPTVVHQIPESVRTDTEAPITPQRALPPRPAPEPVEQPAPIKADNKTPELAVKKDNVPVPVVPEEKKQTKTTKPTAVSQYDYEKDEDNEVSFEEGDLLVDIEFVDEEWWSGTNSRTGETGVFPASYVTLNDEDVNQVGDSTVPVEPSTKLPDEPIKAQGKTAIAEYDYEKEEDNEIGFNEGDLIVDIEFVDEDWWSGKHSVTGEVGVFPGNFVALQ